MRQSWTEAISLLKWVLVVILGLSVLRVLFGAVGIPIGVGGKITSTSVAVLLLFVIFGVVHARRRHGIVDILLSVATCVLVYNLAIVLFLGASDALNLESSYYLHPSHVGPDPDIPAHMMAHLGTIPFMLGFGLVLAGLAYGLTRLGSYLSNRRPAPTT